MGEFSDHNPSDELLCRLAEVDEDDGVTVSSWEAGFIEGVLHKRPKHTPLSPRQEIKIRQILEKYE